jgi:transcriptional regulator NrdR family protein
MTCPKCKQGQLVCKSTRETLPGTLLRYRVCDNCGLHRPSIERLCGESQTPVLALSSHVKQIKVTIL